MTTTTDPILAAVLAERKQLENRLKILAEMERKLTGKTMILTKAPPGTLKKAVLASLRGSAEMTSAEIKARVIGSGYDRPINGQVFTSTLRKLAQSKLVVKMPNGAHSTYRKA